MSYLGNTPTQQGFTPAIDYFSGNASTVAFTLSRPVASVAQVQAVIENVPQNPGDAFTVSGNTITFTSAPPSGTNNIYVYYTSPITQVIQPGQGTVAATQIDGNFALWNKSGSDINYTAGNVGIGTSSPAAKLHVSGTTEELLRLDSTDVNPYLNFRVSGTRKAYMQFATASGVIIDSEAASTGVLLATQGTVRLNIDSSGRVLMPYQPAFRVSSSTNQSISAGTPTAIQINNVNFDIGSNINTSTHRFTVPVSGRYLFTMAIQFTGSVTQPHATISVNGSSQEPWIDWGGSSSSAAFQSRVMNLSAGDFAQLYCYIGAGSGTSDGARCVFTGFLIG